MIDGRTCGSCSRTRVEATPDAVMAIDQDGRSAHLRRVQGRGRARRGRPRPARHRRGRRRVVAAADLARVARARRRALAGSARSRTRCCRSTASARSASSRRQAGSKLLDRPGHVARLRLRGDGPRRSPADSPGSRCSSPTRALPQGDPSTLPPPPAAPADPADLPIRWYYYTSGTTADPKGAQHTDATIKAAARRDVRAPRGHRGRPHRLRVPVHPHRRRRLHLQRARLRLHDARRRGLRRRGHAADPRPRRRHPRRRGHAVPHGVPRLPAQPSRRGAALPRRPRLHRRRRAEAAAAPLRRQGRARQRRHRVGLRHDRGADRHDGVGARQRRGAGRHRGRAVARRRPDHREARRHAAGVGEEGEIRVKGADGDAGLPRLVARRRRVRRDGYLRTGDLGRARRRRQRRASPAG